MQKIFYRFIAVVMVACLIFDPIGNGEAAGPPLHLGGPAKVSGVERPAAFNGQAFLDETVLEAWREKLSWQTWVGLISPVPRFILSIQDAAPNKNPRWNRLLGHIWRNHPQLYRRLRRALPIMPLFYSTEKPERHFQRAMNYAAQHFREVFIFYGGFVLAIRTFWAAVEPVLSHGQWINAYAARAYLELWLYCMGLSSLSMIASKFKLFIR